MKFRILLSQANKPSRTKLSQTKFSRAKLSRENVFQVILAYAMVTTSQFALAQGVDRLTQFDRIKGRVAEIEAKRNERVQKLHGQLNTGLQLSDKVLGQLRSFTADEGDPLNSSAYLFKQLLSQANDHMVSVIRQAPPIPIDPKMTVDDLQVKQAAQNVDACIPVVKQTVGLDNLLGEIMFKLDRMKKKEAVERPLSPAELAASSTLREITAAGPKSADRKSIIDILGDVHDLQLMMGRLRIVHFTRDQNTKLNSEKLGYDKKVSLSLSMLVSVRSREDEAFLRVQQCLVDYFTEQKRVFGTRLEEIKERRAESSSTIFSQAGLFSEPKLLELIQYKDSQREAARLKFLLEDRTFKDTGEEADFIEGRLARLEKALPFLENRLMGATRAHQFVSALTVAQQNYLIDLFLQAIADDIPVTGQVDALQSLAMKDESNVGAWIYYRQISRDLDTLEATLKEERAKAISSEEDRKAILKGQN
ncbi:MAG: hypothetical protein C5B49_13600 [Bdellovibrio sp.]|nr:MAG: hypothetical protein C5B49_13600 [Bdellovibrio sp.]